ncbi:MAG: cupin domain-containing protein [Gammaproteobacteria bacterium]|uniref:cupin domain-containing protein n=1 Tax=Pseudomaricurvus alcaniphilus TaxID=1166482 RepID=UPI00140C3EC1|nr:cupin domain-containing protein [Pseudomaricurvus alcaniphilus]MBR9909798.1 cupin domain-containing protein [Gammaproteobacteria bacterium]NHN38525.1 cupin domain-containing protein [Pseudomaricurvus alcaniphilus]
MINLFANLPEQLDAELVTTLLRQDRLRIERIVSQGHTAPAEGWYDQAEHEWVLVLQGGGTVEFEDGDRVQLGVGDHLNIPAHSRHRVVWTHPDKLTVWLAVFYPAEPA